MMWEDEDLTAYQVRYRRPSGALMLFGVRAADEATAYLDALTAILFRLRDPTPGGDALSVAELPVPVRRADPPWLNSDDPAGRVRERRLRDMAAYGPCPACGAARMLTLAPGPEWDSPPVRGLACPRCPQ